MFLGLILVISSLFSNILTTLIGFLLFLILSYDLSITKFFANSPISILKFNLNFIEMILIYLIFLALYILYRYKSDIMKFIIK